MATEVNKNKKWASKRDVIRRRKKSNNQSTINAARDVINLFISAVKLKHM